MPPVVRLLCLAEVLTMVGVFAFPALLPQLRAEWALSNAQAGWIAGVYFGGYALAVPVLMALTDRVDARRIYMLGAAIGALGAFGFALLAEGFWTGLLFRALAGVGLAGTYMPGLKCLVDRIPDAHKPRHVSFYTASFSLGTAASFLLTGEVAALAGWRWAFAVGGLCALGALLLAWRLPERRPDPPAHATRLLDFRPVARNRPAMGYVLGYTAHMWELFGLRSWLVAFLVFAAAHQGGEGAGLVSATTASALSALVAMVASILGADLATRWGRPRMILVYMLASGLMSLGFGFLAGLPWGLLVGLSFLYAFLVQLDSAALTTGAVLAAEPGRQGATMAVHSLLGFTSAFLAPMAFGAVLDAFGGDALAWGLAFASLALVGLLGPLALLWSGTLRRTG